MNWIFDEDDGTIKEGDIDMFLPDPDCQFKTFDEFKKRALIATAAPKLLEALKLVMKDSSNFKLKAPNYMIDQIEAAIAQAEGK